MYLGNNTSATEFGVTLNSSANTSGNGANSATINGAATLYLQNGGTNAIDITGSQVVSLPSLAVAGETDIVCWSSSSSPVGELSVDTTVALCTGSSREFKLWDGPGEGVIDPDAAYRMLQAHPLRPYLYHYKPEYVSTYGDGHRISFMAEDVCAISETLCVRDPDGTIRSYDHMGIEDYIYAASQASLWTRLLVWLGF
jgi:hypothetical protein